MRYENILPASFLSRPNRFIARCQLPGGGEVLAHVKNTGRCAELFLPGTPVFLQHHDNPARKTQYSLIAVQKGQRLINVDSQIPNAVFREGVETGIIRIPGICGRPDSIRAEVTYGSSRFDFRLDHGEHQLFAEVKGVTLEEDGIVRFPDAPTQRGVKHLRELNRAKGEGYGAAAIFIVQMEGVRFFAPNSKTDPEFAKALQEAKAAGVELLAYDCGVTPDSITALSPVPMYLQ